MEMITAEFAIIKSTWGISVKIDCHDEILSECKLDNNTYRISDKIYLNLYPSRYSIEGILYLYNALLHHKESLQLHIASETVYIIKDVEFNHCDFQDEGMYCVMIAWLNKRYNLSIPFPEINFKKAKNKYVFDIRNELQKPIEIRG